MDLRQLNYFLKVCEEKSFSKAATKKFITQQGISRSVQELEKELGVLLFERSAKGVHLNEFGYAIESDMRLMYEIWENIVEKIDVVKYDKQNTLRIAAALGTFSAISYDLIPAFKEKHPDVILELEELPDKQVDTAIEKSLADIVLAIAPIEKVGIETIHLKTHRPRILINVENSLSQKNAVTYFDIVNEPLFMINDQFKVHHNFIKRFRENGLEPNIMFTTGDIRMVHRMVRLNKGIGLTIDFVTEDFQTPNVKDVEILDDDLKWEIILAWKSELQMPSICQKFISHVQTYIL